MKLSSRRCIVRRLVFCLTLLTGWLAPVEAQQPPPVRRKVGVAFGGGSARGFAHVGVIRWFEEHRVPIDFVAGTSMGGLIGGAFATGMSSAELERLLAETDWNQMFGASSYRFKSIRRKEDARAYPSRLEFGLKQGLAMPASLNNGQQVDLMLTRLTVPYSGIGTFADLPTPFRCVAVDLRTANQVVLDRGSVARALRATMSLPGIFPPVEIDGQILVDGGALNNVPADVVRSMGADVVIAVNVGETPDVRKVSSSMLGLIGSTVDAMMLAGTRRGIAAADLVLTPDLEGFGSLDWRRARELIDAGYRAAEASNAALLPLALDADLWRQHVAARDAKRRTAIPQPTSLVVEGASTIDERRIRRLLEARLGQPVDAAGIERDIAILSGLDAYETIDWDVVESGGQHALAIRARPKPHAPPFLMVAVILQNTTSEDFSFQLAGRYLAYDVLTTGSELRIDAGLGSQPSVGAEFLQRLFSTRLFVALSGALTKQRFNFVTDDVVVAQYDRKRTIGRLDVGLELGRDAEMRVGVLSGRVEADLRVGDPILPSLDGGQTELAARAIYDGQDSVVVPSSGTRLEARLRHVLESPDPPDDFVTNRTNDDLTQGEVLASKFWSIRSTRDRLFLAGGLGTSFDGAPLPTDQFVLGLPLRLGAFDVGERRGDHYLSVTGGYLRGIGRLPDFLGGPIFAGGWVENGSAFDELSDAQLSTHLGFGLVMDTLLGPALAGTSIGFDGNSRFYIALGRVF
jgi:NTE family protein